MEKYKSLLVEASRDHGKSLFFSFCYPLFKALQAVNEGKPEYHICLISYSEEQSKKNLRRIRMEIESNPAFQCLRPPSKSHTWDTNELVCNNGVTLTAKGFGSSVRGGHYHLVVGDDICKDHGTMNLDEQINFVYGVLLPAVRRGEQLIFTGNPVDLHDMLENIEDNAAFHSEYFPCWDEDGNVLWPEQWPMEALLERQKMVPAFLFAREYLLQRISAENSIFKPQWIKWYTQHPSRDSLRVIMTIDPSLLRDAMGIVVTGTDTSNKTYVLDRISFKGSLEEGVDTIFKFQKRWEPNYVGMETYAFQKMYKYWIEKEMGRRKQFFNIEEMERNSDVAKNKNMRIQGVQPKMARGMIFFHKDHKPLVDQFLMWKPENKHSIDDEIDAMSYQVPMWEAPDRDAQPVHKNGLTFDELAAESEQGDNTGVIDGLFSDMLCDNSWEKPYL